jgi:phytoene/squalene synthetase
MRAVPISPESLTACARLVEQGDPDRFLAAMAVPPPGRGGLMVLYAFNLEIARAPWVTQEPLVARMRLQFWRDVVAEPDRPRAHEVAEPLAALIRARALPASLFETMIAAREDEIDGAHLTDAGALTAYLEGSAGALMALAVRVLGGAADPVAREHGQAQGLANYLMAVPAIQAAGRPALPPDADPAALAREGLARLKRAGGQRGSVPRAARPALLAAWRAGSILRQAASDPGRVGSGGLGQSEFARRGGLLWATLIGGRF